MPLNKLDTALLDIQETIMHPELEGQNWLIEELKEYQRLLKVMRSLIININVVNTGKEAVSYIIKEMEN